MIGESLSSFASYLFGLVFFLPIFIGYMCCGAMHSPLRIIGLNKKTSIVTGYVAPGYESVKETLENIISNGMEDKVQACAFVDGKVVVNLVGCFDSKKEFHPSSNVKYCSESIQNIFSSTKAITSIVVAMLVDKGYLKYEDKISDHWKEFSANNKADITLEDLLKHQSGLEKFPFSLTAAELHRDALKNIKTSIASSKIAAAVPSCSSSDPKRAYHFVTRDIILNEIVIRADPKHRTIGEIVRDELAIPLGISNQLTLGNETIKHEDTDFPLVGNSSLWLLAQCFNIFNRKASLMSCVIALSMKYGYVFSSIGRFMFGPNYGNPSVVHGDGEDEFMYVVDLFNSRKIREAEIPSANGHASAYALAKVASIMANGGTAHGVTLLNSNTYELALSNPTVKYDNSLFTETKFVKGGWAVFDGKFAFGKYRHGFIGWFGLGGSVLQWRSDLKIGFGYTNTLMGAEIGNKHGALIQYEIVECTKRLKKKI